MAGSVAGELRRLVAIGDISYARQGCLILPVHWFPMGLGMMALCVALLLALVMAGGGELVITGRGCAMVIVPGISVASFASA